MKQAAGRGVVSDTAVSDAPVTGEEVAVQTADAGAAPGDGAGFAPLPSGTAETSTVTQEVTIQLDRRRTVVAYREGNTLLQTARMAGLRSPSSCETGSCATCMARLVAGSARMLNNDALTDQEVADGWILTCQSLPTGGMVTVIYE